MSTRAGEMEVHYTAKGKPTYALELWHDDLKKHRVIKGEAEYIVLQKARLQAAEWNERWAEHSRKCIERSKKIEAAGQKIEEKRLQEERKRQAAESTEAAAGELQLLTELLKATLEVDDRIDWDTLKNTAPFPEPQPTLGALPPQPTKPVMPARPQSDASKYQIHLGLLDRIFPGRKARLQSEMAAKFESDSLTWRNHTERLEREYKKKSEEYRTSLEEMEASLKVEHAAWSERRAAYLAEQRQGHEIIDAKRLAYERLDPEAIVEYCDLVLAASSYPDYLPQEFELQYDTPSRTLLVDYQLPAPDDLPTLKAVKYVAMRDSMEETHITQAQKLRMYDDVLYQIVLRTLHELFEADTANALDAVAVNGIVTSIDRTSGKQVTACVLSVRANKDAFMDINLAHVDPKACFKALKGVGSAKLSGLAPVAPVMQLRRDDGRFVAAYDVADSLDEGYNLAAMDWEDFEHLIREVFEKEFSSTGGEVKVTQASRDGGVDAIAFDPDPIRGGKIVIQAKRYTNTVGVAAVRDLYGTVMAEGATKGVLVTTSDYGTDSYAFANGKPLVLLNGGNLLHMLEKHGYKARIDIREARLALS